MDVAHVAITVAYTIGVSDRGARHRHQPPTLIPVSECDMQDGSVLGEVDLFSFKHSIAEGLHLQVRNKQESRRRYWATRSSVRSHRSLVCSLAHITHSLRGRVYN